MAMEQEQVAEWLRNPVTQAFKAMLSKQVESAKAQWAAGQYLQDKTREAGVLGMVHAYTSIVNADAVELSGEMNDE